MIDGNSTMIWDPRGTQKERKERKERDKAIIDLSRKMDQLFKKEEEEKRK